ncbi:MAG: ketoacyl-ACP synthase III [Candidatus Sumerlaeia bacterium]
MTTHKRFGILGIGSYIPEKVLTNHDLEQMVATTDEWITTRTGIKERRLCAPDETASTMGAEAARRALADAGLQPADIDLVVCCTFSPDNLCPSTACHIIRQLGIQRAALDVNAACTGFVYGLATAHGMLQTGLARRALVIGTEALSRVIDWTDRSTCVIFADGAGAVVLGEVDGDRGILSEFLMADGSATDLIIIPAGGSAKPITPEALANREHCLRMSGNEVFKFAVRILGEAVDEVLRKAGLTHNDIDWLVPHQANIRIIDAAAKRTHVPRERIAVNIDRVGNTSAASIPLALDDIYRAGKIKRGDVIALVAFGAGLTWGATLLRW